MRRRAEQFDDKSDNEDAEGSGSEAQESWTPDAGTLLFPWEASETFWGSVLQGFHLKSSSTTCLIDFTPGERFAELLERRPKYPTERDSFKVSLVSLPSCRDSRARCSILSGVVSCATGVVCATPLLGLRGRCHGLGGLGGGPASVQTLCLAVTAVLGRQLVALPRGILTATCTAVRPRSAGHSRPALRPPGDPQSRCLCTTCAAWRAVSGSPTRDSTGATMQHNSSSHCVFGSRAC